jgi:hypothetical protein
VVCVSILKHRHRLSLPYSLSHPIFSFTLRLHSLPFISPGWEEKFTLPSPPTIAKYLPHLNPPPPICPARFFPSLGPWPARFNEERSSVLTTCRPGGSHTRREMRGDRLGIGDIWSRVRKGPPYTVVPHIGDDLFCPDHRPVPFPTPPRGLPSLHSPTYFRCISIIDLSFPCVFPLALPTECLKRTKGKRPAPKGLLSALLPMTTLVSPIRCRRAVTGSRWQGHHHPLYDRPK